MKILNSPSSNEASIEEELKKIYGDKTKVIFEKRALIQHFGEFEDSIQKSWKIEYRILRENKEECIISLIERELKYHAHQIISILERNENDKI